MQNLTVFTVVDYVHQLGMMLFLGTIVLMSLRLLGVFMARRAVSDVARDLRVGMSVGLATMLVSGPLMAAGEPVRWYGDDPFRVKMSVLLVALVFHFVLFRRVTARDDAGPVLRRATAILALVLWFGVGWMGRLITVL